jgi:hypothetical protein|tara:strand:+ start:26 stop:373 length:348 start_codon:yes stop_codon:yes gene_type:complete
MFVFGEPQDVAEMFRQEVHVKWNKETSSDPIEQQPIEDLKITLLFAREAYLIALRYNTSDEALDILLDDYDRIFTQLASISERFRQVVLNGRHRCIGGNTDEQKIKYKNIVKSVT